MADENSGSMNDEWAELIDSKIEFIFRNLHDLRQKFNLLNDRLEESFRILIKAGILQTGAAVSEKIPDAVPIMETSQRMEKRPVQYKPSPAAPSVTPVQSPPQPIPATIQNRSGTAQASQIRQGSGRPMTPKGSKSSGIGAAEYIPYILLFAFYLILSVAIYVGTDQLFKLFREGFSTTLPVFAYIYSFAIVFIFFGYLLYRILKRKGVEDYLIFPRSFIIVGTFGFFLAYVLPIMVVIDSGNPFDKYIIWGSSMVSLLFILLLSLTKMKNELYIGEAFLFILITFFTPVVVDEQFYGDAVIYILFGLFTLSIGAAYILALKNISFTPAVLTLVSFSIFSFSPVFTENVFMIIILIALSVFTVNHNQFRPNAQKSEFYQNPVSEAVVFCLTNIVPNVAIYNLILSQEISAWEILISMLFVQAGYYLTLKSQSEKVLNSFSNLSNNWIIGIQVVNLVIQIFLLTQLTREVPGYIITLFWIVSLIGTLIISMLNISPIPMTIQVIGTSILASFSTSVIWLELIMYCIVTIIVCGYGVLLLLKDGKSEALKPGKYANLSHSRYGIFMLAGGIMVYRAQNFDILLVALICAFVSTGLAIAYVKKQELLSITKSHDISVGFILIFISWTFFCITRNIGWLDFTFWIISVIISIVTMQATNFTLKTRPIPTTWGLLFLQMIVFGYSREFTPVSWEIGFQLVAVSSFIISSISFIIASERTGNHKVQYFVTYGILIFWVMFCSLIISDNVDEIYDLFDYASIPGMMLFPLSMILEYKNRSVSPESPKVLQTGKSTTLDYIFIFLTVFIPGAVIGINSVFKFLDPINLVIFLVLFPKYGFKEERGIAGWIAIFIPCLSLLLDFFAYNLVPLIVLILVGFYIAQNARVYKQNGNKLPFLAIIYLGMALFSISLLTIEFNGTIFGLIFIAVLTAMYLNIIFKIHKARVIQIIVICLIGFSYLGYSLVNSELISLLFLVVGIAIFLTSFIKYRANLLEMKRNEEKPPVI